ncbi:myoD family inhibitor-like isoform X2 [Pelobates fuscus]|uniref:myoD family inhibitor-like isoform X2 n=1 Tax=Pelobates fuscus TaxID=191477 RepID=UPI002FE4E79D
MNDGPSTSFEASGRMSGNPRLAPAETVLEEDHGQTQTQPPIQQLRRGPEPNVTKNKGRKSTKGNSIERSKLSAKHIEEAAGDDRCTLCLLAVLFCEVSLLCSSLVDCASCGLCGDGVLCGSVSPEGMCCASAGSMPCAPGCMVTGEACSSSDCLDIMLECCSLCFPS